MAAPRPDDIPFVVSDVTVRHRGASRPAMVVTPKRPMVVGRDRLQHLRRPNALSPVERWLIGQARTRGDGARIVLFRAMNGLGERVWQFDPGLTDSELTEGGYIMTRALLPFHRRFMACGVVLMVHTDWGLRECYAMRDGVTRYTNELASGSDGNPEAEVDRWMLHNMLLHVALSMQHVVESLLPAHLSMIERRIERVRSLVSRLPASALD